MKDMMSKMQFKPRGLKMNCENESKVHKARIVGFSVLTAIISGSYQWYYHNMTYRAGQMQA